MAFCTNCGTQLDENAKFCPSCGTSRAEQSHAEPVTPAFEIPVREVNAAPAPEKASGNLNVAQLVWAIINLLLCCGTLFGIVSLILTVIAKDAPTAAEEAKNLKIAKICNLVGTILSALFFIIYIIFFFVMFALASTV